jgi:tetratricopeptide (TPR) repeat protein
VVSQSGALEQEIAFYKRRLQRDPGSALDLAFLAEAYLARARATRDPAWYLLAEQAARRSLQKLPYGNATALLALARVAEAGHDFPQALALARRALQEKPDSLEAWSLMVTSGLGQGDLDLAQQAAAVLVQRAPTVGSYTLQALVHQARGRDGQALAAFARALRREQPQELETSSWCRSLWARLLLSRGRLAPAQDLASEALRLNPRQPTALLVLGEVAARRGRWQEALDAYTRCYNAGQEPVALLALARLEAARGRRQAAEEHWRRAEETLRQQLAASPAGHRRDLARLLLERGRPGQAAEALSLMRAEAARRRDGETLKLLGWALGATGSPGQALQPLEQARRSGWRDAELLYLLARVRRALGQREQAASLEAQARQVDPTLPGLPGGAW